MGRTVNSHEKGAYGWQVSSQKAVWGDVGIREMPTEITMSYHYSPMIMSKIKKTNSLKCRQGCNRAGTLTHSWCVVESGMNTWENSLSTSLRLKLHPP